MKEMLKAFFKILKVGGWAPLLIFSVHVFSGQVLNAYDLWPSFDIPMHFSGGFAIAFFISRCFETLPREAVPRNRRVVLELLLIGCLTSTAAVFWEFGEFTLDQVLGSNVQLGLANTIKDMALGIAGSLTFIFIRARQLHAGTTELRELTNDWVHGRIG